MKRLTIAYLIDDLSYGGAQKQLSLLVRALPARIHPVVVSLSQFTVPFAGMLSGSGVEVAVLERRSHADVRRLFALVGLLRKARVDVVHSFLDAANVYGWLASRMLRKPVVLSVRSDHVARTIAGSALPWILRRADHVTVNSRAGERYLRDKIGVSPARLSLVTNCVAGTRDTPHESRETGGEITIGFIGRLSREKRVDVLVEAFAILHEKRPDTRLVLMGAGRERGAIERLVHERALDASVELRDPSLDVEAMLARLDCLVLPSAFEGLPNVVMEALAAGVPVVASRVGDLPELVLPGKTGVLVDEADPAALARSLAVVIEDAGLREAVHTKGPELIRERFSTERVLEQLTAVYEKLAGGGAEDG